MSALSDESEQVNESVRSQRDLVLKKARENKPVRGMRI